MSRVRDPYERKRHEWGSQHLRCWLSSNVMRALQSRQCTWFVYWPHWIEVSGNMLVADGNTWLKRTCQMSWELQPFELIFIPKDFRLVTIEPASAVTDPWEKSRH